MSRNKSIIFNGVNFVRDAQTGYWRGNAPNGSRTKTLLLHRVVWESVNGPIPEGYAIHHIDYDKSNNDISNLRLMSYEDHRNLHSAEMTDERRQWCRNNIIKNAVPAARRWHSTPEGHAWHIAHIKDCAKLHEKQHGICIQCGREFIGAYHQKFCSNNCKSKWRREQHIDDVERVCKSCGGKFTTNKYNHQETCGRSCANHLRWMRKQCA